MAVQDRLDDILQARSLPDDLIAPGHLPANACVGSSGIQTRAESRSIKLGEDAGVDRMSLIFAWAMTRTCSGFAITTFLTCGAITAATDAAFPVASTTTTSSFESFFAEGARRGRRMSTRPSR